ncbi:hypothetical protein MEQU1_003039 [Malassezia equina]|uniref:G-patch domain-containing protein n=1 Tax=Malassezia equina TaxID=1381935 RepID=A0AAF0J4T0_9BASI|nr:hypothetical protein MEQU1_003039 [Malassezia equina]
MPAVLTSSSVVPAPRFVRSHNTAPEAPMSDITLPPQASSAHPFDAATFAERLMAKYGYKEGEGLGAEGNKGITTPLLATKVPGKRGVQRGAIVNHNKDETQEETLARYGEPSEVIVLKGFASAQVPQEQLRQKIKLSESSMGSIVRERTVYFVVAILSWIISTYDYFKCVRELEAEHTYLDECEGHSHPVVTLLSIFICLIVFFTVILLLVQHTT